MAIRMIVADDSATIQKVIKIALSQFDVEIFESRSFVEALSKVGADPLDIIVADANLSGVGDAADFSRLREQASGVPILMLVGSYESIDEEAFRAEGFEHLLKKPFESHEIVAKVDELTEGRLKGGAPATPRAASDEITVAESIESSEENGDNLSVPDGAAWRSESTSSASDGCQLRSPGFRGIR